MPAHEMCDDIAPDKERSIGGQGPGPQQATRSGGDAKPLPLTDAEMVQLQIRLIALESVVIALLAESTDRQLDLVRDMVAHISPRSGFTQHRLTMHAAAEMISLVDRA